MAAFGTVIAVGGGAAGVAYLFFRFLGEKWINAKFEERLAAYKHVQQQELERLKLKINTLMDRTTKLHQREFDTLPEAWSRLVSADGGIGAFTSSLQEYPDVNRMTAPQLEHFLDTSELVQWQKEELRSEKDKNRYYQKAIYWHRKAKAREAYGELYTYLARNGIFMPSALKDKFAEFASLLWDALMEHEFNVEDEIIPRERDKKKAYEGKGKELRTAIETEVQGRLWSIHATDI